MCSAPGDRGGSLRVVVQGSFCILIRAGNKWHNILAVLIRWNKKRNTGKSYKQVNLMPLWLLGTWCPSSMGWTQRGFSPGVLCSSHPWRGSSSLPYHAAFYLVRKQNNIFPPDKLEGCLWQELARGLPAPSRQRLLLLRTGSSSLTNTRQRIRHALPKITGSLSSMSSVGLPIQRV